MLIEDQRFLHEDLERLEQAISDRVLDNPRNIRDRLRRDHEISHFLDRISAQSSRLLDVYADTTGDKEREIRDAGTGDPFESFYTQLSSIKDFHRRYPNEQVENLERSYKRRGPQEDVAGAPAQTVMGEDMDMMFTGEEAFGRFFDLTTLHERYLNLPGIQNVRRFSYLQYLDFFDVFTPPQCVIKRQDKLRDEYFRYIGSLAEYLESFMRRTRPLEPLAKIFAGFDREFEEAWSKDEVPGWGSKETNAGADKEKSSAPAAEGTGEGIWCKECEKEFSNQNVYKNHLGGKKHKKAAEAKAAQTNGGAVNGTASYGMNGTTQAGAQRIQRLKERAVAEREFRIRKLASAMQTTRSDTKVNVERRQGMTERERQQELEAMYAEANSTSYANGGQQNGNGEEGDSDDDAEEKIYNPLKLPLDWTGKPIPFWLYKLHGLGVEYPCEICGNFVYMGRRAFEKHFGEARHVYGLKCLGITRDAQLFRDITSIEEAQRLWRKLLNEKTGEKKKGENVVQMEDAEGNVMPEKVYWDLQKQGLV